MKRYILTGTPGAGKTSVLHELKSRGYSVIEEAATDLHQRSDAEPWRQADFIDRIIRLQQARQIEAATRPDELQLYDRSPICTLALSQHLGYPPSEYVLEELQRIERENIYQKQVFFFENLGFIQPTQVRKITFEDSLRFEKIHAEVYTSLGYDLIKVPPVALSQRVEFIICYLAKEQY
jgi:predicted ATPase